MGGSFPIPSAGEGGGGRLSIPSGGEGAGVQALYSLWRGRDRGGGRFAILSGGVMNCRCVNSPTGGGRYGSFELMASLVLLLYRV